GARRAGRARRTDCRPRCGAAEARPAARTRLSTRTRRPARLRHGARNGSSRGATSIPRAARIFPGLRVARRGVAMTSRSALERVDRDAHALAQHAVFLRRAEGEEIAALGLEAQLADRALLVLDGPHGGPQIAREEKPCA